jgi:hypothetical protein
MRKPALSLIASFTILASCLPALGQKPAVKLDRTDAPATAAAVLRAYAAKDLAAMAELSNADNRQIINEMIAQRENHPRWRSAFVGGRWDAVSNWKGNLGETRYFELNVLGRKDVEAQVQFAETSPPGKLVVVSLVWEGGKWCFQDIKFPASRNLRTRQQDAAVHAIGRWQLFPRGARPRLEANNDSPGALFFLQEENHAQETRSSPRFQRLRHWKLRRI